MTYYAKVVWSPYDVIDKAKEKNIHLSFEQAEEFLLQNQKQIQSDMAERGWDSIDALLDYDRMIQVEE